MYYPHRASPVSTFDLHPKVLYASIPPLLPNFTPVNVQGVIPLGGATIDHMNGLRSGQDALSVRHKCYGGRQLVISAETDAELKRWEAAIQQCRLVYVHQVP